MDYMRRTMLSFEFSMTQNVCLDFLPGLESLMYTRIDRHAMYTTEKLLIPLPYNVLFCVGSVAPHDC